MSSRDTRLSFSFYGIGVFVESEAPEILDAVEHDFSYFLAPVDSCRLRIECRHEKPDYKSLPVMMATSATPRNICFKGEEETYIDYFGNALNIYHKKDNTCRIITDDVDMARAIAYLTILSRVSELLDQEGIHRVHALGLEHNGRGVLLMLPVGGGKTTLAMSILMDRESTIKLISEDSPLIRRDGTLLPFPVSVAVRPEMLPEGIDGSFTHMEKRLESAPKVRIDVRYFTDRIATRAVPPSCILLGRRSTGDSAEITSAPKSASIKYSLMNSVIGVGLYQGMEFIMQKNASEVASQMRVLASRMYNNLRLVMRSRIYAYTMGRDITKNYRILTEFLDRFPATIAESHDEY